jgi:hypothetical protein
MIAPSWSRTLSLTIVPNGEPDVAFRNGGYGGYGHRKIGVGEEWRTRRDLNPQPLGSKPSALSN